MPLGSVWFHFRSKSRRSIVALDLEADALVAPRILAALGGSAGELDRLGDALDRDLAGELDLAVVVGVDRGRVERDLRVLLDVEEVGRLEVAVALLLAGVDARDLDGARQAGASPVASIVP